MVAAIVGVLWLFVALRAAPEPLVRDGQIYVVIWACFPVNQNPCYGEVVKVEKLREDGWADVISCREVDGAPQCRDDRWRSNLGQALSIKRYVGTLRAAN